MALPSLIHAPCNGFKVQRVGAGRLFAGPVIELQPGPMASHEEVPDDTVCQPFSCVGAFRDEGPVIPVVVAHVPEPAAVVVSSQICSETQEVQSFSFISDAQMLNFVPPAVENSVHSAAAVVLMLLAARPVTAQMSVLSAPLFVVSSAEVAADGCCRAIFRLATPLGFRPAQTLSTCPIN